MDVKFLKDMIKDEMENAEEYAKEALEIKTSHPKWANKLMDMSERTVKHVECLHDMLQELNEDNKKNGTTMSYSQSDYDSDYRGLIDDYADRTSKIRSMKEMYYRR